MNKFFWVLMAGVGMLSLTGGARADSVVYSNPCNSLAEWNDNSSGAMSVENDGTRDYVHFQAATGGATLTLRPNLATETPGVTVRKGYKLIFDAKGWANDFSVNFYEQNTNTCYWLTGSSANPWVNLPSEWTHFELTIPADGLADYICFNVYASDQQANIAGVKIMEISDTATLYANPCDDTSEWSDNYSGMISIESGGPSGTYLHFEALITGATLTLRPNMATGNVGVDVKAGDKLVFDAKGVANDFSVDFSDRNTWTNYKLTGTPSNQWVYLGPEWTHFEFTVPADAKADYISFNVYASGQEVNLDNFVVKTIVVANVPGDANGDGAVDVSDLGILAANYGMTSGATLAQGDFNGDGAVDVSDLGILAANYGTGTQTSADFNADYAKVFGTAAEEDAADDTTSSACSSLGLSLIAGLALMGLMLVKLEE